MNRARLLPHTKTVLLSVFAILLVVIAAYPLLAESAGGYYKRGQAAEAAENWDLAFENYQKALAKNPRDLRFREAYYRVRGSASGFHLSKAKQLEASGDDQAAMVELLRAAEIDPSNEAVAQEIGIVRKRQQEAASRQQPAPPSEQQLQAQEYASFGSPVDLKPVSSEPVTLHMTEDAKVIYQAIGRAAGINVLFDSSLKQQRITVDLTSVTLLDALRIVGVQSNTFWRAVTPNTIFVAENNTQKRRDLDEQAIQTFYLTNAWKDTDLTDATTAIRNVLGTNVKAYSVASQNAIIVRGTPDELALAGKLINDIDKAMPEVVVDIAIMEVSKNWERTLGIAWPGSVGVSLQSTTSTSSSSSSSSSSSDGSSTSTSGLTLYNLANLNSNNFAVTMGSATANLLLSDANTKVLQSPRLRATNMQKATMKIGEKIPIATGTFSTGASTSILAGYAQTQFQYIDVGVNIEMTPTIHADGDVTLKLKIEDTNEGSNVTISGVTEPIIIQKTSEQVIRMKEGEVSILGGILEKTDSNSWSGIPGLSSIPIIRYLFGSKDHTIDTDELVFMLVPHIVRTSDIEGSELRPIDTGTGQSIQLRRLPVDAATASVVPVVQTGVSNTAVGTYIAPSAASAAPTALADMRKAAEAPMPPQTVAPPPRPAAQPAAVPPPPHTTQQQPAATPAAQPVASAAPAPASAPAGALRLLLNNPGPVANGSTFQVPVVISGAADISSVPLEIHYDPSKLTFTGVDPGDFLGRDGQVVKPDFQAGAAGSVTVHAARTAGTAGISGAGVVVVLNFKAKAAGTGAITINKPLALNSKQQAVPASATALNVTVK